MGKLVEDKDYYFKDGFVVLTESFLKNRKFCCGVQCLNCPYEPKCELPTHILMDGFYAPSYKKGVSKIKK